MLLAQINRDSQGMAEFHDADGQPVTLCLTEAVTVAGESFNSIRLEYSFRWTPGKNILLFYFMISLLYIIMSQEYMHTIDNLNTIYIMSIYKRELFSTVFCLSFVKHFVVVI